MFWMEEVCLSQEGELLMFSIVLIMLTYVADVFSHKLWCVLLFCFLAHQYSLHDYICHYARHRLLLETFSCAHCEPFVHSNNCLRLRAESSGESNDMLSIKGNTCPSHREWLGSSNLASFSDSFLIKRFFPYQLPLHQQAPQQDQRKRDCNIKDIHWFHVLFDTNWI